MDEGRGEPLDDTLSFSSRPQQEQPGAGDEHWMQRALARAKQSKSVSSPNPAVGCVLVKEGALVGEGFHNYDRKHHAEIVALQEAGDRARDSTAYVTLEPCCHTGRTGPCTEALIAAGVRRVVVATLDPNPKVSGRGLRRLREAGLEAVVGVGQQEARTLNDAFACSIGSGHPFVTLKAGVSLDGRIAPRPGAVERGRPYFLTGPRALAEVQVMRHEHDVLLTGINTVLTDNPQLTDRTGLPRRRPLLRVVLDSALRLPLDSKLVRTAQDDVLVFCSFVPTARRQALESMGVHVEALPGSPRGRIPLDAVLRRLHEMQMLSVMLEAGGMVNASALAAGLVDKLVLYYAPVLLGGAGVALAEDTEMQRLALQRAEWRQVGPDLRYSAYLRDPWQG
jgi:diaminohydroxyphosphoribosylaminopyrimidine deaminase/5-amino-6-(5-phosphoribosylamino)uracil reductase